ncbi:type II toxin-antitoxin system ParD family antitoxin [Pleurocapsa sp. CCALA 161]|uniref:type II toxin-antitoxin system ParD family antitoxin n=1 Tax=Pleurocapsa sp. CCALA 161 TaxID=2107688 RepID=UPI000D0626F3|nr:type II toxin-antitoxin system ParD family antitoxin [Pleurocapsa sp. CCALA 161]PSB12728.1 type II toxin-antitoxin system ParD family antitoxin [Pleurocapsa sp. CCALA 161]
MKSINISLPEEMRIYIEEQVASGGYSTTSEYIRQLIRQDRQQKAEKQLEQLLLEGLNSGEATPMTAKDWAEIRQAVTDKIAARKNNPVG